MSGVLYAWELGNNLGHLGAFLPVARQLRAGGHTVHLALRETVAGARLDGAERCLQAPFLEEIQQPAPPLSYADILVRFGFTDGDRLRGHLGAWLGLFDLCRPQVVAADHAPAALLAARVAGLPAMLFGTGFYAPPARRPLPVLRPWSPLPEAALAAIEDRVVATLNAVLVHFGAPPLAALHELFAVAETALLGFPEVDHYADRGPAAYWGNLLTTDHGEPADWPQLPGRRIFAYLRAATPHLEAAIDALIALRQPTLLVCPDLPAPLAARLAPQPHLRLSRRPLRLADVLTGADLGVTYGGFSTTLALLQAGKPVLVLPGQLEQFLLARRIAAAGLGALVHPERPADGLKAQLAALLDDAAIAAAATAFADRYRDFGNDRVVANLTRRLLEIAGDPR